MTDSTKPRLYSEGLTDHHREAILKDGMASCIYCLKSYPATQIERWTDGNDTAICPLCGVDAVVPGLPPLKDMLAANDWGFGIHD